MAQDPRQISLRRHLSPLTQFLTIAILALFVGAIILAWPVIGKKTDNDLRAIYEYLRWIPSIG